MHIYIYEYVSLITTKYYYQRVIYIYTHTERERERKTDREGETRKSSPNEDSHADASHTPARGWRGQLDIFFVVVEFPVFIKFNN